MLVEVVEVLVEVVVEVVVVKVVEVEVVENVVVEVAGNHTRSVLVSMGCLAKIFKDLISDVCTKLVPTEAN